MAEKFKIEEMLNLPSEGWRPLPEDEFKKIREIREDNADSQNRLAIISPKAEGKRRSLIHIHCQTVALISDKSGHTVKRL